jgi:radical SAM superfamily enzyme YgiQ (UPF0313 family)
MKILLVNPFGSNWVRGSPDNTGAAVRLAPVGILSIASYLAKRGNSVDVHDCRGTMTPAGAEEVVSRVRSEKADLVGFTAVTSSFPNAYRLAERIKEAVPRCAIVFGGVHVSALRGKILERFPAVDFAVAGEGEKAMAELASGAGPETIRGLSYRDGTGVRDNAARTDPCDLDDLPFPGYRMLEGFPKGFEGALFNYPRSPSATIVSSRGCPYRCTYCDRSVYGNGYRRNSARYLYEHMAFLKKDFGIRHVFFYDDLFTFDRGRTEEFCGLLRRRPLGMTFNCAVRVGHADDGLLGALKASGCWMVSLGIESGDPEVLARHKAAADFEEMKATVRRIQGNGLRAKGLFMMGLPGETEASVNATADLVDALELDDMNLTKFTPFPGSPLYRTIREEGTFEEEWELMNCMNFVFVPWGFPSRERLEERYGQFIRRFYTGKNWVRKFGPLMLKSPHSTGRMLRNLPTFLRIRKDFAPGA